MKLLRITALTAALMTGDQDDGKPRAGIRLRVKTGRSPPNLFINGSGCFRYGFTA
jgi:hypothetical protein